MNKEDLEQIKEAINFALINSRFKDEQGFVFNKKAQTSLNKIEEQLLIQRVSKSFNSEEELLQFIYIHTPIAIKPKSKRAKGQLVPAFKSGNAFEQVCKHLAKKLFNVY